MTVFYVIQIRFSKYKIRVRYFKSNYDYYSKRVAQLVEIFRIFGFTVEAFFTFETCKNTLPFIVIPFLIRSQDHSVLVVIKVFIISGENIVFFSFKIIFSL